LYLKLNIARERLPAWGSEQILPYLDEFGFAYTDSVLVNLPHGPRRFRRYVDQEIGPIGSLPKPEKELFFDGRQFRGQTELPDDCLKFGRFCLDVCVQKLLPLFETLFLFYTDESSGGCGQGKPSVKRDSLKIFGTWDRVDRFVSAYGSKNADAGILCI
jgi:hypothetical protein